jgi:hypothetical protein
MYDALVTAAAKKQRPVSEEIRARIEETLMAEIVGPDTQTAALTVAINRMVRELKVAYGNWHKNPFAFEIFKASVATIIGYFQPKGEPAPPKLDPNNPIARFYGAEPTPEAVGKIIAARATIGPVSQLLGLPSADEEGFSPTPEGEQ